MKKTNIGIQSKTLFLLLIAGAVLFVNSFSALSAQEGNLSLSTQGFSAQSTLETSQPHLHSGFSTSSLVSGTIGQPEVSFDLSLSTLSTFTDSIGEKSGFESPQTLKTTSVSIAPLTFPNPFKLSKGAQIGYTLPEDMPIDFRLYSMTGRLVASYSYPSGTEGGKSGYNRLQISSEFFNGGTSSAGVYFYLLLHNGKVIARERMVVLP